LSETIEWLQGGEPWVVYRTRLDLLGEPEGGSGVIRARRKMISHPQIQALMRELENWPGTVLSSHRSASQPFHRLSFIADLGLRLGDPHISEIVEKIYAHKSCEGPFKLLMNIPRQHGGSGDDRWAWALCDAPIIVYSLVKFGLDNDVQIRKAVGYLASLVRENGWPCAVSKELGRFRGPGRKGDPCPFATLAMLKLLSQLDGWKNGKEARIGAETLLTLWENSREMHPYMFYMGTDFRKLKAPFIWYDILHVLDVLSRFEWLKNDKRLLEMANLVKSKADSEGRYTPESEWRAWKGWDFGQKKQSSRWLTFLVLRIMKRIE